jgi:hypothetical protein
MRMEPKFTPANRAEEYLERIAALSGAQQDDAGAYLLTTGRIRFLAGDKFVRVISHHGESTCFSPAEDSDMPRAELVASALPQLKNNPGLFEKWRELQGYAFKADGQMFTITDFLTT